MRTKMENEVFCYSCGEAINTNAEICVKCGVSQTKRVDSMPEVYCFSCGEKIKKEAEICVKCGVRQLAFKSSRSSVGPVDKEKILTKKIAEFMADKFLIENRPVVENKLKQLQDDELTYFLTKDYKSPETMFWISLFLGWLGIDRFVLAGYTKKHRIKHIIIGIVKLSTWWTIIGLILPVLDICNIKKTTQRLNFEEFIMDFESLNQSKETLDL
jgi:ribosomal protein L40E/TM2 domain-containing membrane protein YozV